jgi:hypothetical protein
MGPHPFPTEYTGLRKLTDFEKDLNKKILEKVQQKRRNLIYKSVNLNKYSEFSFGSHHWLVPRSKDIEWTEGDWYNFKIAPKKNKTKDNNELKHNIGKIDVQVVLSSQYDRPKDKKSPSLVFVNF